MLIYFANFECLFSINTSVSKEELESSHNLLKFYAPLVDSNNATAELKLWRVKLARFNLFQKVVMKHFCCVIQQIFLTFIYY